MKESLFFIRDLNMTYLRLLSLDSPSWKSILFNQITGERISIIVEDVEGVT